MDYAVRDYRNMEPNWLNEVANAYQPSFSRVLIVVRKGENNCISLSSYQGGPNVICSQLNEREFFETSDIFNRNVSNLQKQLVIDFYSASVICADQEVLRKIEPKLPSQFHVEQMTDVVEMRNHINGAYGYQCGEEAQDDSMDATDVFVSAVFSATVAAFAKYF